MNAFKSGYYSLQSRSLKRLRERGKRVKAEVLASLIGDLGGEESMSVQQRLLAQFVARDIGIVDQIDRAVSKILKTRPTIRDNPAAIARLDSYSRPIMNSAAANLQKLGLARVPLEKDISEQLEEASKEEQSIKRRTVDELIAEVRAAKGETDGNGEAKDD